MPTQRISTLEWIWRRRFGVLVGTIAVIIAGLFSMMALQLFPPGSLPPAVESMGRLFASDNFPSYLAVVELVLLLAAIALTAFHFRHERAARFIERFNSPDVMAMRGRVDDWLGDYATSEMRAAIRDREETAPEDDRLRLSLAEARLLLELERDPDLDKAVKAFANLFQEIGEAYENRTVSPSYTRRMFDVLVSRYWNLLRFWIEDYRLRASPTLYARFGRLADSLTENPNRVARLRREEDRGPSSDPTAHAIERRAMLSDAARSRRTYIFGYGSLVARRSRQHATSSDAVQHAVLHGWARAWNTVERVIFEGDSDARPALFLGLALARDGACNGVLVEIDEAELPQMDRREKNYLRIDVSRWIEWNDASPVANAAIYTYVGRPAFTYEATRDTGRWEGLVLPGRYRTLIDEGLSEAPDAFVDAFQRQTFPVPPVDVDPRAYRFVDPVQNRSTGRDRLTAEGEPAASRDGDGGNPGER